MQINISVYNLAIMCRSHLNNMLNWLSNNCIRVTHNYAVKQLLKWKSCQHYKKTDKNEFRHHDILKTWS